MELRSSRKRNEYKELQITLHGMGFYEEGMELQEMRQILDALHQSVSGNETNFFDDDDLERALRESEMDFMPSNNGRLWNSTMMGHPRRNKEELLSINDEFRDFLLKNVASINEYSQMLLPGVVPERSQLTSSPCSSPEIPPQVIIVQAEVHHPLNWSPQCSEEERLQRKRLASTPTTADNNHSVHFSNSYNEIIEPDIKRIHKFKGSTSIQEPPFPNNAPGVNLNNESGELLHASSSTSNENGGSSTIEIVGPISMRRPINDSGVNSGNENDKSSSMSLTCNPPHEDSNTVSISSTNSHEIVGPISARRPINDSGVAVSNETGELSSSSWDFNASNDNSVVEVNSSNENRLPYSLQNDYDDDYEHSEPSL